MVWVGALWGVLAPLSGCAPALPGSGGWTVATVAGDGFRHRLFVNRANAPGEPLTVYLGGDGRAWLSPRRPARDPTPRRDLALDLMARDPGAAAYLGRPCYHGLAADAGCGAWWWTHGRYGEAVVTSLAAALHRLLAEWRPGPVTLVGYSGGGALAVLLAPRVPRVTAVVTVAGNLDPGAWGRHHGYSPLVGSLDPVREPPLPRRIRQLHLFGAEDREVPRHLAADFLARQPEPRVVVVPGADHHCCWEQAWPALVAEARRPE